MDSTAFDALRLALADTSIQVIAPDLPGFGKSGEPPFPWTVDDYAHCIEELVLKLDLQNVHLLGHSFGGRIAIKLAARQGKQCHAEEAPAALRDAPHSLRSFGAPQGDTTGAVTKHVPWISHLYLCAAAGVGRDLHIRRVFWLTLAKFGNAFLSLPLLRTLKPLARKTLYRLLRVRDYEEASERMRQTMGLIVAENLTPLLEKITVPTDLFWGSKDTLTPLADGQLMNKKIVQSKLHIYEGMRHRVHIERAKEIAEIIRGNL